MKDYYISICEINILGLIQRVNNLILRSFLAVIDFVYHLSTRRPFLQATSESLYNVRVCVLLIGNLNSLDHSDSPNDFRFPHVLQKKKRNS